MNIIKNLTARIEARLQETKNPCKMYASEAAAEKAVAKVAAMVGNHHAVNGEGQPARYTVFFLEAAQKWVAAIDLTECINREGNSGGYVGLAGDRGFYTY